MKVDIYNTDKKYNVIYADPPWHYNTWRNEMEWEQRKNIIQQ